MINTKIIKALGLAATAISMGATLLADWVDNKKMEAKVSELLSKKLAEL